MDNEMPKAKFKVGARVLYRTWAGETIRTRIEANDEEKNGQRVYILACGNWAYEDQLTKD